MKPVNNFPEVEIDNLDAVIDALNGTVNSTIITSDGRLPDILCKYINTPYTVITEDMFYDEKSTAEGEVFNIKPGEILPRQDLINKLTKFGYSRVLNLTTAGEFSVRGDSVDLWPENETTVLIRIMLDGNKIETIKSLAAHSFTSLGTHNKYSLQPIIAPFKLTLDRMQKLLDKCERNIRLVFKNPDEFNQSIQDTFTVNHSHMFDGFTCIGFQMTDSAHSLFEAAKTVTIKSNFEIPSVGELVVHIHHGIGRFMGFKKMRLGKTDPERNYLVIQYAKNAFVYLPPEKTELLSNYYGLHKRLNSLGRIN